jgi:hypothetical protein
MKMIYQASAFVLSVWRPLCAFALLCAGCLGQTKIDVSQCFSEELVTNVTQNIAANFLYNYLSVIDEKTYYKVQANSSATALLPVGLFSGDWNAFQEARRNYFQLHSESLSYYQAVSTNTKFLPPEWRGTIDNCINRLTQNSGYGVLYFPVFDDPTTVRLELKYRSTGNETPRVRSSQIENGNVVDGKGQSVPLYRACYFSWLDLSCPRLDTQSEFIMKRTNPNMKMHVILNLDNSSQSTGFDIDILPKKQRCVTKYEPAPPVWDKKDIEIHHPPSVLLDDFWGGDPNRLQLYFIRLEYPGKIVFASCAPSSADTSYNHVMNNDPNQRDRWQARGMNRNPDWNDNGVFQCLGMTNTGNTRFTHVEIEYQQQISHQECTDVDW